MADKPLKSITFPGLTDKYTVPVVDNTLAVTGAAADAKKVGDELTDLKGDISELNSTINLVKEPTFDFFGVFVNLEQGGLNTNNGAELTNNDRVRTGFSEFKSGTIINSSVVYYVLKYNADHSFNSNLTSNALKDFVISTDGVYRLLIKTGDVQTAKSSMRILQPTDIQTLDGVNEKIKAFNNIGVVEPEKTIYNFSLGASAFDNTYLYGKNGHRYTVVMTPLTSATVTFGILVNGSWKGSVSGISAIGSFTATQDGFIFLSKPGTSQTVDVVYIFDTTSNDTLLEFLKVNTTNAVNLPYSGALKYLDQRIDSNDSIVGYYLTPLRTLTNFAFGASAFDDTGYSAVSGHRYTVVFTPLVGAFATVGVIVGGVWKGSVSGRASYATFTATANGDIYFSKQSGGTAQTIDTIYIFDTTGDDELKTFIETNLLNTPDLLYHSQIIAEFDTWYKGKSMATLGDSVTQQAKWIPSVISKFGIGTITNCGIGGTRVSGTNSNAFWQDARVNAIPLTSDFITIMGGTNDGAAIVTIGDESRDNFDVSTFIGAYNVLISKLLYKFSSSGSGYYSNIDYTNVTRVSETKPINILIITCGFCGSSTYAGTDFSRMKNIADACVKVGKLWGIPVADIYHNAGINPITYPQYLSDNVHPNEAGGKRIASVVIGIMGINEPVE